ncbi:mucin-1 [Apis mellifera]|uniref:Mucin-1 n=1 Tax=Apis mellifera TaxID=7460 RepID=A0A7M7GBE0_APIME|nr:mucin-1 [Apis mellifera]|eukprot:XP_003251865.2 mucin-1 [Apis mellifera]
MKYIVPLFIVFFFAIHASECAKKIEKRGLLGSNGHGHDVSGFNVDNIESGSYLPPLPSVGTTKKSFLVSSVSSPSYSAPVPSYSAPVYRVPVLASVPSYNAPVSAPVQSYNVHVSAVPSYTAAVPAPTYGVPVSVSTSYGVPSLPSVPVHSSVAAPVSVSVPSLNNGVGVGSTSVPSTSYGVPSNVVHSVPSNSISSSHISSNGVSSGFMGSLNVPNHNYGVSSFTSGSVVPVASVAPVTSSVSLSHSQSYDVPSFGHHLVAPLASVSLSQNQYSAPSSDDGYSYPVPSKQLV